MRRAAVIVFGLVFHSALSAQEANRPIGPEEAIKRVDQKVTVLMEVKSTGGNTARFLNSEADFRFEKNFAVFIPNVALEAFKKAGIADPGQHYKGKTIVATGMVALSQGRPQIRVENPDQIKVVSGDLPGARVQRPIAK
jgi:DNA/RNA endonuclease YhcR with UshA esterase domain